jgi:hypothetical protein
MLNGVVDNWQQPDEDIWEVRGGRQHFVYSKRYVTGRTARLVSHHRPAQPIIAIAPPKEAIDTLIQVALRAA